MRHLILAAVILAFFTTQSSPLLADSTRIVSITISDTGELSEDLPLAASVDVVQNNCAAGGDPEDPESFSDTIIAVKIASDRSSTLKLKNLTYAIKVDGRTFQSKKIGFIGKSEVSAGEESTLLAPIFRASGGAKYFHRSTTPISSDLGFENMRVTVSGRDSQGRKFSLRSRVALSFGDFDRCS